jgi:hypothetical protein
MRGCAEFINPRENFMTSHRFSALAAATLAALLTTAQASAYEIATQLQDNGSGLAAAVAGIGFASHATQLFLEESRIFPLTGSEVFGKTFVDLATGVMRGHSQAISRGPFDKHEVRFTDAIREHVEVRAPLVPPDQRFVHFSGLVHAIGNMTNAATTEVLYQISINNTGFSAVMHNGLWSENGGNGPTTKVTLVKDGLIFDIKLPIRTGIFDIALNLEGTALTIGHPESIGPGYADVNADNTARIAMTLPEGATYISSSGVFLTAAQAPVPEPETWATLLAGGGVLALSARRRRPL